MIEPASNPPIFPTAQPAPSEPLQSQGCLSEIGYTLAGLALPAASLGYYRLAVRRKTLLAVLLFFLLGTLVTVLITLSASRGLYGGVDAIQSAYDRGEIPAITIQDGVASVDGPQPVDLSRGDLFMVIDTTGKVTEIDTNRYESGFLLTRTELHVYNTSNQYQRLQLGTLQEVFAANPLVIDRESVSTFWAGFSTVLSILILFFVWLWTTVIRLAYIALLALPIWGLASLIKSNTSFNTVFITGLLASVPATYTVYLLEQAGINFVFLGTLVILVFWLVFLVLVLNQQDRPLPTWPELRPWRALLAVPALSFFGLHMLYRFSNGALICWILAVVTVIAVVALSLLPRQTDAVQPMI